MKKTILTVGTAILFIAGSATFIGCGNSQNHESESQKHVKGDEHHKNTTVFEGKKMKDLSLILEAYFQLKNALVKDDGEAAATASKKLLSAINGFDMSVVSADNMKKYMEISQDATENADHISENADKLEHQREHFVDLSEDMNDLIGLIGTNQKLYQDFCPMANDNKGATWISEVEEIQNPYLGTKMPTCGKVQKELGN